MDRAEAIMDRTEAKLQKSKGHFKVIKSRNRAWDDINKDLSGADLPPKKKASKDPSGDAAVAAFNADDDAEMEEVEAPATKAAVNDDDDEIL